MGRKPSVQTLRVLSVMLENPMIEHYGLELSKGAQLASGTIYPILRRLEQQGWVVSRWEDIDPTVEGRPRKRLYQLTGSGARQAREHLAQTRRWLSVTVPAAGAIVGSLS
jgi:PadR family transcriptional regulator, regulatory protein PadR